MIMTISMSLWMTGMDLCQMDLMQRIIGRIGKAEVLLWKEIYGLKYYGRYVQNLTEMSYLKRLFHLNEFKEVTKWLWAFDEKIEVKFLKLYNKSVMF